MNFEKRVEDGVFLDGTVLLLFDLSMAVGGGCAGYLHLTYGPVSRNSR